MNRKNLVIYLDEKKIGILHATKSSSLSFTYSEEATMSISITMPLNVSYGDSKTRVFFENLLPEGDFRKNVALAYGRLIDSIIDNISMRLNHLKE